MQCGHHFVLQTKGKSFTRELERSLPHEVVCLAWCATMDLLAVALRSGEVEIRRLSWQRVAVHEVFSGGENQRVTVTQMCWRADGQVLGVGGSDGSVHILAVDPRGANGPATVRVLSPGVPIAALHWVMLPKHSPVVAGSVDSGLDRTLELDRPLCKDYFGSLPKLPKRASAMGALSYGPNSNAMGACEGDEERIPEPEVLDLLVLGDVQGNLAIWAMGIIPLVAMRLQDLPTLRSFANGSIIEKVHLSAMANRLGVVASVSRGEGESDLVLKIELSTQVLHSRFHELTLYASHRMQIDALLEYTQSLIDLLHHSWQIAYRLVSSKFGNLASLLRDYDESSTVADELLALLITRLPSDAVHQFFSQQLSAESLSRMQRTVRGAIGQLSTQLRSHLQRALEEIIFRLGELRGLARWKERYACIGMHEGMLSQIIDWVELCLLNCLKLQQLVGIARVNYSNFFAWITKCAEEFSEQPVRSNDETPVSFDLEHVADFISKDLQKDRIGDLFRMDPYCHETNISSETLLLDALPCIKSSWTKEELSSTTLPAALKNAVGIWKQFCDQVVQTISPQIDLSSILSLGNASHGMNQFVLNSYFTPQGQTAFVLSFILDGQTGYTIRTVSDSRICSISDIPSSEPPSCGIRRRSLSLCSYKLADSMAFLEEFEMCDSSVATALTIVADGPSEPCDLSSLLKTWQGGANQLSPSETVIDYLSKQYFFGRSRRGKGEIQQRVVSTKNLSSNSLHSSLAVCGERGVAAVLLDMRRVIIYDTANDETGSAAAEDDSM